MMETLRRGAQQIRTAVEKMPPTRMILLSFGIIILIGTLLLMLPVATRDGNGAPLETAFFTATSATCVTGLVIEDTYTYWTLFGQLVLLVMIQLGGLGFMSVMIFALTFTKKKIGLRQRVTLQEAVGAPQVGGIVRMARFILIGALAVEAVGAVALSFFFCPRAGIGRGIYFAVFHSVSAFCNAGIDLMGYFSPGSSLATAGTNPLLNWTMITLILISALGFFVWADLIENGLKWKKYRLHTKLVLVTTLILFLGGSLGVFLLELGGTAMHDASLPEKLQYAVFQSVTCRTAGFATLDLTTLRESTQGLMIILMLIGGSSGSTAGGMKTTTVAVLLLSVLAVFRKRKSVECFGRRMDEDLIHNACCVLMLYLTLMTTAAIAISAIDAIPLVDAMFEAGSAVATVGLSLNRTAELGTISHLILAALMFIGRVGGITILLSFNARAGAPNSQYPAERITIG